VNAVVDTNVLVSGIFWAGKPGRILQHWKDGRFFLLATTDILDEYIRVISGIGVKQPDLASDWTDFISKNVLIVLKTTSLNICRDPNDNKFLECAVSAKADCIVSGDDDLLSIRRVQGTPILKASTFLSRYFKQ
jgi:uncharacterized protein